MATIALIPICIFLLLIGLVSISPSFAQSTQIIITGEQYPLINTDQYYQVVVEGELQERGLLLITVYLKDDPNKNPLSSEQRTVTKGSPLYFTEVVIRKPIFQVGQTSVIEVRNGDAVGLFEITPIKAEGSFPTKELAVTERSIRIMDWFEARLPNHWVVNIEICTGKEAFTLPIIHVSSDIETVQKTLTKSISAGSCARQQFEIKANDPESIQVSIVEIPTSSTGDAQMIEELKEEIELQEEEISKLKENLEKKDAVIMEQVNVIMDLANKIKATIFEKIIPFFYRF